MGIVINLIGWVYVLVRPSWASWRGASAVVAAIKFVALVFSVLGYSGLSRLGGGEGSSQFYGSAVMLWLISVLEFAGVAALIVWGRLTLRAEAEWKKGEPARAAARAEAKAAKLSAEMASADGALVDKNQQQPQ